MTPWLASLSLVVVVGPAAPSAADLHEFAARLARKAVDLEIILVANGAVGGTALALKALIGEVPDLSVVFLAEHVHDDIARLVGIEHAVGDFVLFCDLARDRPGELRSVLAPLRDGYDLVLAERPGPHPGRRRPRWLLQRLLAAYGHSIGAAITLEPTGMRVFSRAAALHVAACPAAELRLRAHDIGPSFPALSVPLPPYVERRRQPRRRRWADGVGLLLSASTLPLRSASYAAALGGGGSALYSLYVFAVFLLQPDVAPGWTTLSLQLSGTLFVFSIVLLFLSEQVIQIRAAAPAPSRRFLVVRELRSPLSRRRAALNVVDADGAFQLGKPSWLDVPALIGAALIGHTGFVGGTLARAAAFDACYNSATIDGLRGQHCRLLVCAGVDARKWRANQDPAADRAGIARLTDVLATATADELVLISTVDVYGEPGAGCDEEAVLDGAANHPYGRHRLALEAWCGERFPRVRVLVRLPALFGPGLRKNALFDLLHGHMPGSVNPRATFQWYPLERLWADIGVVRRAGLGRVNLVPEPLPMQHVLHAAFPGVPTGPAAEPAPYYDVRTRHAALFGAAGHYMLGREASLAAICRFVASERG